MSRPLPTLSYHIPQGSWHPSIPPYAPRLVLERADGHVHLALMILGAVMLVLGLTAVDLLFLTLGFLASFLIGAPTFGMISYLLIRVICSRLKYAQQPFHLSTWDGKLWVYAPTHWGPEPKQWEPGELKSITLEPYGKSVTGKPLLRLSFADSQRRPHVLTAINRPGTLKRVRIALRRVTVRYNRLFDDFPETESLDENRSA